MEHIFSDILKIAKASAVNIPQEIKPDLESLAKEWKKTQSPSLVKPLLQDLQPTINKALTSFAGKDSRNLGTRAKLLALDAIKTYDPSKQTRLKTHVMNSLQRLNRYRAQRANLAHIPENVIYGKQKVEQAMRHLEDRKGREPTIAELSDYLKVSPKKIQNFYRYSPTASEGQYESEIGIESYGKRRDPIELWKEYVYKDLSPTEKKIFEWSTGYRGVKQLPKGEIARKLKIHPSKLSQIINNIANKLQNVKHV